MTTSTMMITRMLIATLGVNSKRSLLVLIFILGEMRVNASASPDIYGNNNRAGSDKRLSSRSVTTKYGALRGYVSTLPNPNLHPIEIFMGVPYASPPVGKLRFMPPVTPAHWHGVKSAHQPGPVCPQNLPDIRNESQLTEGRMNNLKRLLPLLQNQSEDCLYLNIFAPASVGTEAVRLPVIVFIHGESFEWNAGSAYDGSVLASYANLVVVTINYRLGVLGFFPALDGSSRGNFGLMDQVAALHWIQENIGEFGGDPTNVTVMGHKEGAACLNILMISPMSKGLFHRAIMQSGSILSPWAMATDAVGYSRRLAKEVGCPDDYGRGSAIIDCLRQKSAVELVSTKFNVPSHLTSLGPTVDGIVIPSDPSTLMSEYSSTFGNYDLLFGVTKVEYYQFTRKDETGGIDSLRRDKILRTLVRNLFTYHLQEIYLTISNEYTDWTQSSVEKSHIFQTLIDILSDATVIAPSIKVGQLHSRLRKNTYFYNFRYATQHGDYSPHLGCIHGEELPYIFGAPLVAGMQLGPFGTTYSKTEIELSKLIMNIWSNFARFGNPTPSSSSSNSKTTVNSEVTAEDSSNIKTSDTSLSAQDSFVWPTYDEKEQQFLSISLKPKVKDHYQAHRLSYWLNLIPKLHTPGPTSISHEHHLLQDFDDIHSYEGIVREVSDLMAASFGGMGDGRQERVSVTTHFSYDVQIDYAHYNNRSSVPMSNNDFPHLTSVSSSSKPVSFPSAPSSLSPSLPPLVSFSSTTTPKTMNITTTTSTGKTKPDSSEPTKNDQSQSVVDNKQITDHSNINASISMMMQQSTYSTALSVTIGIGCSFLILNILIFAGILYQKDRNRQNVQTSDSRRRDYKNQTNKTEEMHCSKKTVSQGAHAVHSGLGGHGPQRQPGSNHINGPPTGLTINTMYPGDYISSVTGGQHHNHILAATEVNPHEKMQADSPASGSSFSKHSGHVSMVNSIFYSEAAQKGFGVDTTLVDSTEKMSSSIFDYSNPERHKSPDLNI